MNWSSFWGGFSAAAGLMAGVGLTALTVRLGSWLFRGDRTAEDDDADDGGYFDDGWVDRRRALKAVIRLRLAKSGEDVAAQARAIELYMRGDRPVISPSSSPPLADSSVAPQAT